MYKSLSNIGEVCFFVNMKQPWRDITLLKAIAGRLRELRAEKGVSQETVYEDTGIHIGKIETEKYNITVSTSPASAAITAYRSAHSSTR